MAEKPTKEKKKEKKEGRYIWPEEQENALKSLMNEGKSAAEIDAQMIAMFPMLTKKIISNKKSNIVQSEKKKKEGQAVNNNNNNSPSTKKRKATSERETPPKKPKLAEVSPAVAVPPSSNSQPSIDNTLHCVVFSDRFHIQCTSLGQAVKFYNPKLLKPISSDLSRAEQFFKLCLMVIASIDGIANKSSFSIQNLLDLTMKPELLAQVDRFYRSVNQMQTPAARNQFVQYVQNIDLRTGIYGDTHGLFVVENYLAINPLFDSDALKSCLSGEQNVWIICLDPLDIVVIVKNEADRIFIEEETAVDTAETTTPPTTITASFYGKDGKDLIYSLTTTSPILAEDLASNLSSQKLINLIRDEAQASKIIPTDVDFDFEITKREVTDDNHLSITIKAPELSLPPKWENVTPREERPRPRMYRDQNVIGRKLFDKFKKIVGANIKKFERLEVCVATANYTTLKEQTLKRIKDFGLYDETSNNVPVWLYNVNEKKNDQPYREFRERVRKDDKCLFVLIADEAHWGYNAKGANSEYVNFPELLQRDNFFVLQVTATPYNILTKQSRLPEVYKLKNSEVEVVVRSGSYAATTKQVTVSPKLGGPAYLMNVDQLDFEEGEQHIVDWSSTIAAFKQSKDQDKDGYSEGKQYYGLDYFSKSQSSIRSDDIFEQLCDKLLDEQATLLADYAFSMLFFKKFFEFGRVINVPTTEAEWNDLWDKTVSPKLQQLAGELFTDLTQSLYTKNIAFLNPVMAFYYGKSIGKENQAPANADELAKFCTEKFRAIQNKGQHNHLWTETDKIVLSFLEKACHQQGTMKLIRIGSDTPTQQRKQLSGEDFVKKLKWLRGKLEWHNLFAICPDFRTFNIKNDLSIEFFNLLQSKSTCCYTSKYVSHCTCTTYDPNNNRYCNNCGHVHRKLESYEDLGSIPVLLILVSKGRLGDTFPRSMDCLDLRIRHRKGPGTVSSAVQELGRMCRYADLPHEHLPYSLVSKALHNSLRPVHSDKILASAEHFAGMNLDSYMLEESPGVAAEVDYAPFKWRRQFNARQSEKEKERSMDFGATQTHKNRLLLMAEPQIGKTEAYLRFWELLKQEIQGIEIVPTPACVLESTINADTCLLPYWKYLTPLDRQKFHEHAWGKYHSVILARRKKLLFEAYQATKDSANFEACIRHFINAVTHDERVTLDEIKSRLNNLQKLPIPFTDITKAANVLKIVNYDNFFTKAQDKLTDDNLSLFKTQSSQSKDLWEKAEYTAVKPMNCLAKYKLAMPAQVVSFSECEKCTTWSRFHNVSLVSTTVPAFSIINDNIEVKCLSAVQVSVPNTIFYVEKWKAICEETLSNNVQVVFTPSYRVSSGLALPEKALCNYTHATSLESVPLPEIVQILVVRESTFARYKEVWGKSCIIVCLPDVMTVGKREEGVVRSREEDVRSGGIGYARLFIQVFAYHLGLHWIHVWDDNVQRCWKIDFSSKKMVPVYFEEAMKRLESVAKPTNELVAQVARSQSFLSINQRGDPVIKSACPVTKDMQQVSSADGLFGFYPARIALVGMGRWHMALFNVVNPFQQKIVYSAVYLNTKLTVENGVLYPCKTVMEDIDFQNLCFENNMHVIKTNEFIHTKLNWTPNTTIRASPSFVEVAGMNLPNKESSVGGINDENGILQTWLDNQASPSRLFLSNNLPTLCNTNFIQQLGELPKDIGDKTELVYFYALTEGSDFTVPYSLGPVLKKLRGRCNLVKIYAVVPICKMGESSHSVIVDGVTWQVTKTLYRPPNNEGVVQFVEDSPYDVFIFVLERMEANNNNNNNAMLKEEKMEL